MHVVSISTAPPPPPSFHPSLLVEESVRGVDEALAKYDRDIHIMNNRPQRGGNIPTHKQAGMSEEEKHHMQVPCHVSSSLRTPAPLADS